MRKGNMTSPLPFSTLKSGVKIYFYSTLLYWLAKRIKQLQKNTNNANLVLRLSVEGGGCSGFQYVFKMEDRIKAALEAAVELEEEDEVLEDR